MKKEEQYKKWILAMYDKYKSVLFLEKYAVKVEKDTGDIYLGSKVHFPYLDGTILWSDRSFKDWQEDKKTHERRIVHEFCHIVTDPLYCVATERYASRNEIESARERLTDHIAQIINKHYRLA